MNGQTEEKSSDRTRLIDCHMGVILYGEVMLLLILGIIAFLFFFKLFREFGKTREIIINMNDADKEKLKNVIENIVSQQSEEGQTTPEVSENPEVNTEIASLQEKFSDFSPSAFLSKAEEMFDAIFNAFANSHHYLLKTMLTESLYESFASQIEKRESKNLRQELLIKHKNTTLRKIQILSDRAKISVIFDVSQMSAMVDSEGVSFDNPKRLYRDVIHKWVFERAFGKDNWILSKTSQGQA